MTTLGTGTVEYRIGDGACIDTGSSVGTGSQTIDVGVWSEGSYEIYLRASDSAGNTSAAQSVTLHIDRTAPTAPQVETEPDGWNRLDALTFTWSGIMSPQAPADGQEALIRLGTALTAKPITGSRQTRIGRGTRYQLTHRREA